MTVSSPPTPTLPGIQALRALAATSVAVAHAGEEFGRHLNLDNLIPNLNRGAVGVDLFFVISGFVMVYASERLFTRDGAFRTFMTRRIIRIVPLYWAMTTVMLLYVIARGFEASDASPMLALASYFFIPYPRPSGTINPLYGLGWTLNYEMMFYVIFACALFARREITVAIVSAVLVGLVIVNTLAPSLPGWLEFWTDPIILEFVFGMGLALLFRAGLRLPRPVCYALVAVALAVFAMTVWGNKEPRLVMWGIPAAMVVASVALSDRTATIPSPIVQLGDASYALYLIHPVVYLMARVAASHGLFLQPAVTPWLYVFVVMLLSIAAAFALHYRAERPVTDFLKQRFAIVRPRYTGAA
ncbi:MAG: acyltransferase [Phycisphaeraceae bacterium]